MSSSYVPLDISSTTNIVYNVTSTFFTSAWRIFRESAREKISFYIYHIGGCRSHVWQMWAQQRTVQGQFIVVLYSQLIICKLVSYCGVNGPTGNTDTHTHTDTVSSTRLWGDCDTMPQPMPWNGWADLQVDSWSMWNQWASRASSSVEYVHKRETEDERERNRQIIWDSDCRRVWLGAGSAQMLSKWIWIAQNMGQPVVSPSILLYAIYAPFFLCYSCNFPLLFFMS